MIIQKYTLSKQSFLFTDRCHLKHFQLFIRYSFLHLHQLQIGLNERLDVAMIPGFWYECFSSHVCAVILYLHRILSKEYHREVQFTSYFSFYLKGWHIHVEKLWDYGVHRVQSTPLCPTSTDSASSPNHSLLPTTVRQLITHRHISDNFGNFLGVLPPS
jgi:hypothetical protein